MILSAFRYDDHIRVYTDSMVMTLTDSSARTKIIITDIDENVPNGHKIRMAYVDYDILAQKYTVAVDAADIKKEDPCIIACSLDILAPYITQEELLLLCARNIKEFADSLMAPKDHILSFVAKDGTKVITTHNFFATDDGFYEYKELPLELGIYICGLESFDDIFNRLQN